MDDIVKEAREALRASWEYDRDNRREALEDLRFTAGFQWPDAARSARANRPMITINRAAQFVSQVANPIKRTMPTIKVTPVDDRSSDDLQEIYNGLLKQIQYQSSASHVYGQAIQHAAACGIGWWRIATDYVDDEGWDQEIMIKRIPNPLSVYPDPGSQEADRCDMTFCIVSEMHPTTAFKKRWPKASQTSIDVTSDGFGTFSWNTGDQVRICEYVKREQVKRKITLLENGMTVDLSQLPHGIPLPARPIREREVTTYRVTSTLVSGAEQLAETHVLPGKWIPIVPVIGNEVPLERAVYRHGIIRFQREPQQLHNLFVSTVAESLGQAAKSPYLATPKQIGRHKALWDSAATTARPYLLYDPDAEAGGPPQRIPPPEFPAGAMQFAEILADDMKATTGIYDASLGARSNETSGVAIDARKQQGADSTFNYIDNLEHALDHTGRIIVDMIPLVYDSQRVLRIIGSDDQETEVPINHPTMAMDGVPMLLNDLSAARFDVRVTVAPDYKTRRAEVVANLMDLAQKLPQVGMAAPDLIAKNMDFDGSDELAERLKLMLPPAIQQANNPQPQGPPSPDPMQQHEMQTHAAVGDATAAQEAAKAAQEEARILYEQERAQGAALDNALKRRQLNAPTTAN